MLTKRETTIAELYAEGHTYRQIASNLFISPATVRNHLASIYQKLEVKNKAEREQHWHTQPDTSSP